MRRGDWIDSLLTFVTLRGLLVAFLVVVGLMLFFMVVWPWLRGGWRFGRKGLYQARPILTPNEQEFYRRMVQALPQHVVLTQVAMSALIEPRVDRTKNGSKYMGLRARFSQKYVDFVVCRPKKLQVVAIVELDDVTHDAGKDALRDEMLEGAFYNVVRWHSRNKPSKEDIRRTIEALDRRLGPPAK